MASVKLASLLIRTPAKPISNSIKHQSQEHPRFRDLCMNLAQWSYRSEYRLRTSLLGESPKAIKPLSEAKAVANGANMLAEGFLFTVAAAIILGETWRSSRSATNQRNAVTDQLEDLKVQVNSVTERLETIQKQSEQQWEDVQTRHEDLTRILDRIVYIGLRGGWSDLEGVSLAVPPYPTPSPSPSQDNA